MTAKGIPNGERGKFFEEWEEVGVARIRRDWAGAPEPPPVGCL